MRKRSIKQAFWTSLSNFAQLSSFCRNKTFEKVSDCNRRTVCDRTESHRNVPGEISEICQLAGETLKIELTKLRRVDTTKLTTIFPV